MAEDLRALHRRLEEHTEDVNAYHRAGERMARERHEEVMESTRNKRSA